MRGDGGAGWEEAARRPPGQMAAGEEACRRLSMPWKGGRLADGQPSGGEAGEEEGEERVDGAGADEEEDVGGAGEG